MLKYECSARRHRKLPRQLITTVLHVRQLRHQHDDNEDRVRYWQAARAKVAVPAKQEKRGRGEEEGSKEGRRRGRRLKHTWKYVNQ